MKHFGEYVREARRSLGLTQSNLAEATGLSVQYISDIERGCARGTAETIAKLCRFLNLSMDEIFLSGSYEYSEHSRGAAREAR